MTQLQGIILAGCGKIEYSESVLVVRKRILRETVVTKQEPPRRGWPSSALLGRYRTLLRAYSSVQTHYSSYTRRGNCGGQVADAHQVVGSSGEGKHPTH